MKPSVEQLGNLLALRRDERPEEGYWQEFICEFHQNQREQAAKKSGLMNLVSGVTNWCSDLVRPKWVYGAGLAYASVMLAFFLIPRGVEIEKTPVAPVNYQVVPAPAPVLEQLEQLDLSPSTQGTAGEQIF